MGRFDRQQERGTGGATVGPAASRWEASELRRRLRRLEEKLVSSHERVAALEQKLAEERRSRFELAAALTAADSADGRAGDLSRELRRERETNAELNRLLRLACDELRDEREPPSRRRLFGPN